MKTRSEFVVGRDGELKVMLDYARDQIDFDLLRSNTKELDERDAANLATGNTVILLSCIL